MDLLFFICPLAKKIKCTHLQTKALIILVRLMNKFTLLRDFLFLLFQVLYFYLNYLKANTNFTFQELMELNFGLTFRLVITFLTP